MDNRRVSMVVRILISFPWVIFSHSNDPSIEKILPYCYFFNILLYWCCPGSRLRGVFIGVGFWGKAPSSVTVTYFLFLLINHPVLWCIYTAVILMTWRQGWLYGRGWMWLQWSMKHFLISFTWQCGSSSLSLWSSSGRIMCCYRLLIFWFGLVFGPNWVSIECLQTQSNGLVKYLDICGEH